MNRKASFVVSVVMALMVFGFAGALPTDTMPRSVPVGPVYIHDVDDLQNMSQDLNGSYELANDIDASATSNWNGGRGFKPIANFSGRLEGGGHTISHLYINRSGEGAGLFGYIVHQGEISNVSLTDASVSGDCVGCLAVHNAGTIFNCSATGYVRGGRGVGGLVGASSSPDPLIERTTIASCSFNGTVNGTETVGGLVGFNDLYSDVISSYAVGRVHGSRSVGGLVGENLNPDNLTSQARIINCYSLSDVTGTEFVGGLAGLSNATILNSYSAGPVNGNRYVGGLTGVAIPSQTTTSCYWDNITSGQSSSAGGTGRDTAAMTKRATFAGWDFCVTWNIEEGRSYPFLRAHPERVYPNMTHQPKWSYVPAGGNLTAGQSYTFAAKATDDDPGDTITYGLTGDPQLPSGMTIEPSTGVISWPAAITGLYALNLTATDGTYAIWHRFYLNVNEAIQPGANNTVILSPANNSEVSGVVNITARVQACYCDGLTQLLVDGTFICNGTPFVGPQQGFEHFYHLWNSSTVKDGRHKITVLGKHQEYSDTVYVTVNNTPPVAPPPVEVVPVIRSILGPNNTKVNATESVTFYADATNPDGGQLSYEWKENGVTVATGPSFTQKFPAGNHTLVLTIGDGIHYVNQSISFVVKPKPRTNEPTPSIPGFGTIAAVAAIAGVVAAGLFWRRERR